MHHSDSASPAASAVRRKLAVDAAALVLFSILVIWLIASGSRASEAITALGLAFAAAGCFLLARLVSRLNGIVIPLLLATYAVATSAIGGDKPVPHPLGGPLGYQNANGALYLIAGAASLVAVARLRSNWLRGLFIIAFLAFLTLTILNRVRSVSMMFLLLPIGLLVHQRSTVRKVIVVCAAGFAAALAVTSIAGATHNAPGSIGKVADATAGVLSERRVVLWSDALDMIASEPLFGAGVGSFARTSPTALSDDDAIWAHHEFLQFGAETGIAGMLAAVLLAFWCFARLWVQVPLDKPASDSDAQAAFRRELAVIAIVSIALSSQFVHACIDYIYHFPTVLFASAVLIGTATAGRRAVSPTDSKRR